jgi:hypothetical protein
MPIWLLCSGAFVFPFSAASQATGVREADVSCAHCHAEIYRKYLETPMANASGPAIDKLRADTFVHKPSSVEYKILRSHDQATLAYRSQTKPADQGEFQLNYFFGSGHLGTTYLYFIDDYLFESPVAWYAASGSYDMKPGLEDMREMPPPLPMQSNCMRCHMSSVQPSEPGTINHYRGLPFLHAGITCESCHGDSQQHVLTHGKAAIVNPVRLNADGRDSVCISCHLEGDITVERAGHSALNYHPGESISTYLAYYVRTGADLIARGVSEVEQLSQSTCKRTSGDRMSCMSCHDPHFTPSASERAAFYRSKCLACHRDLQFAATHHPENPDCTSCHMPQNGAKNIVHVAWTDHRIRRIPEPTKSNYLGDTNIELMPIFSPGATKRDGAMAYYQALLEDGRSFEPAAWQGLTEVRDSIANDKEALDALGNLGAERGDTQIAEQSFKRVLELDPRDLTALSNLGTLLAKQGKLNEAITLLRTAFENNHDIPGLAMNLARVECMAGDAASAQGTLRAAMTYAPDLEDMRQLLSHVTVCSDRRVGKTQ